MTWTWILLLALTGWVAVSFLLAFVIGRGIRAFPSTPTLGR
jgi:hypothetical protein